MPDGALGLLGAGVARPVDRDRARLALDALDALTADDPERFAKTVEGSGLLPRAEALTAHAILRELLEDFLAGPTTLDAAALLALADRAAEEMPDLFALATAAAPQPQDLALGRMLGQLVNVLARLEATEDWPALARGPRDGASAAPIRLTSSSGRLPTRIPRSLSSTGPRMSIPSIRPGSPSSR